MPVSTMPLRDFSFLVLMSCVFAVLPLEIYDKNHVASFPFLGYKIVKNLSYTWAT